MKMREQQISLYTFVEMFKFNYLFGISKELIDVVETWATTLRNAISADGGKCSFSGVILG